MDTKKEHKRKAIALRKQGKSYTEILEAVPVAKSTLSLWLRDVGLSRRQQQQLTAKKRAAQRRGGEARRQQRVTNTEQIFRAAAAEIGTLSARERLLVGIALYWAEGGKQKPHNVSQGFDFSNTDPHMLRFMLRVLRDFFKIEDTALDFGIYIHCAQESRVDTVKQYWSKQLSIPVSRFDYVYFKKHNPRTKRKNIGEDYYGTCRVRVKKSVELQRKISGMIYGITGATWRIV